MNIKQIYPKILYDHKITELVIHSSKVKEGVVFFALPGYLSDGHLFIDEAINKGALTIVLEKREYIREGKRVNFILVDNIKKELAKVASIFYQNVVENKKIIAITGTNGKTTVSTLLFNYLKLINIDVLLIGSNGIFYQNDIIQTSNTTPDLLTIYQAINQFHNKLSIIIIEISSQAIRDLRVLGLAINLVLITNISQDHFDFHPSWEDYVFSKGILLINLPNDENHHIIINRETPYYFFFDNLTLNKVRSFGINSGDYQAEILFESLNFTKFNIIDNGLSIPIQTNLVGRFNVENILAFYAIIDVLGLSKEKLTTFLSNVFVLGRLEQHLIKKRIIIIDYAHTPVATDKLLSFLKDVSSKRILTVIGCGGRRDRLKRPLMAKAAVKYSDKVYFTEDNARGESFEQIISDMLQDINQSNYEVVEKREEAIIKALAESEEEDIIALVGMGYEQYQTSIGNQSDLEVVRKWGCKDE